jgi:uncharacterized membrane protein YbhN (UPF0104 family)
MRTVTWLLTGLGLILLGWMLHEVGWGVLWRHLVQVGWGWPLLLLPYGLLNWLEAWAWGLLLVNPRGRPGQGRLFWLTLSGEAVNTFTPTAGVGGEAYRAARLAAGGTPWEEATASVVIHKGMKVLSLVLYICLGLALAPVLLPGAGPLMGMLTLGAALLGGGGLTFVLLQRREPCSRSLRLLERLHLCPRALKAREGHLAQLDAHLAFFYREYPGRAFLSLALYVLSWLLEALEAYIIFWLLGQPVSLTLALCLDALAKLFTAVGFFIPASLGVQDGGTILLTLGFRLGATVGAAFSILRRLREAFWMGLGLILTLGEK